METGSILQRTSFAFLFFVKSCVCFVLQKTGWAQHPGSLPLPKTVWFHVLPGSHSTSSLSIISRETWPKNGRERNVATGGFYELLRSLYVYVAEPSPASPRCQPGPPRSLRVQACYRHAGAAWPGMAAAPVGSSGDVEKAARREGGGVAASAKTCQTAEPGLHVTTSWEWLSCGWRRCGEEEREEHSWLMRR